MATNGIVGPLPPSSVQCQSKSGKPAPVKVNEKSRGYPIAALTFKFNHSFLPHCLFLHLLNPPTLHLKARNECNTQK